MFAFDITTKRKLRERQFRSFQWTVIMAVSNCVKRVINVFYYYLYHKNVAESGRQTTIGYHRIPDCLCKGHAADINCLTAVCTEIIA